MARSAPSDSAGSARFFGVLLLLSGFCGISYEILYARILGNLVGDQFAVVASILLTFLLGIGFGTLYAHRLWRWLWLLEALIGVCAVFFALGNDVLDSWLYVAIPILGQGLGASMLISLLLVCVPAFLIGTSLPLFAGYLSRLVPGRVFSRAYMMYNFGAALTALLIEFALMRLLGLRLSVLTVASLNGFVALSLLLRFGDLRRQPPAPAEATRFGGRVLTALALASVASAVFQLLMVKLAECLLGPFRETFALVLALILLGLAVGAKLTERLRLTFDRVVLAALGGVLLLLAGFPAAGALYAKFYATAAAFYPLAVAHKLGVLTLLMGLPAIAFGATIPALLTEQRNVARESGQLLFVSSMANSAGFLLMAFVLHRYLDYGVMLLVIAATAGAALAVYGGLRRRTVWVGGLLLLAAGVAHNGAWQERLLYLGHTAFHGTQKLAQARLKLQSLETFKGHQDVFSITWSDGRPWFFINGYLSIPLDSPSEKLVGAFATMFAPRTDRALVLGLGSGATGGSVSLLFDRTDAVEINPVVLENLFRMADYNFDIENQPGLRVFQDDAIHFVKTSRETYSLIINTVTTPLYFSSSKLYTREFLDSVSRRLTPDGVYMTWMDSRAGDRGADIIVKTLAEVFDHCAIGAVNEMYFLLLCSQQEIVAHQARSSADNETLREYFLDHGLLPERLSFGLFGTRIPELGRQTRVPVNTLDYPSLEFQMARVLGGGLVDFRRRLLDSVNIDDIAAALGKNPAWTPVAQAVYLDSLTGRDTSLARRWRDLVRERVPGFEELHAEARREYYAALVDGAPTADNLHGYGVVLLEQQRFAEAVEPIERARRIEPDRPTTNFNLAYCREMQGDLEGALAGYAREAELSPRDWETRYREGVVLIKLSRFGPALEALDASLSIEAQPRTNLRRGQALVGLRRLPDAEAAFRRALDGDPELTEARAALDRLGGLLGR